MRIERNINVFADDATEEFHTRASLAQDLPPRQLLKLVRLRRCFDRREASLVNDIVQATFNFLGRTSSASPVWGLVRRT